MKRILIIFSILLMVLLLVSCGPKSNHKEVFDNLDVGFQVGDSKSSVTKDFTLPTTSELNENATIVWNSPNSSVIKIVDNKTAKVSQQKYQETISLDVLITIKGKEIAYVYTVIVKAKVDLTFTITYDSNGGSNVSKSTVKEGFVPTKPGNPTKEGYVFVEWRLDGVKFGFDTPLTKSIHLVAHWELDQSPVANYQVNHLLENLEDNEYTLHESLNLSGEVGSVALVNVLTLDGFTLKENQDLELIILEDGSLVINVYYLRNVYTVSFDGVEQFVKHGGSANVLTPEAQVGYEFAGWTPEVPLMITEDKAFTSTFNPLNVGYKVNYLTENLDGTFASDLREIDGLTDQEVNALVLEFEGQTLREGQDLSAVVLADGSLVIEVYYDRNVYTVSFDGVEQLVKHGASAVAPEVIVDEGFEFYGWDPELPEVITSNMIFTSVVAQTGADYKVNHYIKNLEDDLYTLHSSLDLRGIIDNEVVAKVLEIYGFILKLEQDLTGIVLADGSLVINVYYERVLHTVTFDGVEQLVKHEGSVILPKDPVKEGYDFVGWNPEIPENITQDMEFTSVYIAGLVNYTVIHHQQKLNLNEYQVANTDNLKAESNTLITITLRNYTGYHAQDDQVLEYTVLADGSLVINIYYDRNVYTVSFDGESQEVVFGGSAVVPEVLVEIGYAFIGWDPLVPNTITQDMSFESIVNPINVSYKTNHYIQNILDDEYTLHETSNAEALTNTEILAESILLESHELITDLELLYLVLGDGSLIINLYYDRHVYEVIFDQDIDNQQVRHGGLVEKPADPQKEGYEFVMWLNNGVEYDFSKVVTKDLNLTAQFSAGDVNYKVVHMQENISDDLFTLKEEQTLLGTSGEEVTAVPKTYEGFVLALGQELTKEVLADGSLVITINYLRVRHSVSLNGETQEVKHEGYIVLPQEDPYREGYEFIKYYLPFDLDLEVTDPVTKDLIVYPKFKDILAPVITINNDGAEIDRLSEDYDLLELLDVVITDNESTNPNVELVLNGFDITTKGTYQITIIATDDEGNETTKSATVVVSPLLYTVIFNFNDGTTNPQPVVAEEFMPIEILPIPSRENYKFLHWTIEGTEDIFDLETNIEKDYILNAQWESAFTYKVTFDSRGGNTVASQYVVENELAVQPAAPQRINYQFNLWYLGNEPYNFNTPITGNITLTASWSKTSQIDKVELDELVKFYQQTKHHQIYVTFDDELYYTFDETKLNLTQHLTLQSGETVKYMMSSLTVYEQNDNINIIVVTSLNNVKCVVVNTTTNEYVGSQTVDIDSMNNVGVLYRYDLFENKNNFIIYGDEKVYLYSEGVALDISAEFDLANDENFVVDSVTIDDPYDFVIKTNKRYFIPVSEALFYNIDTGLNEHFVDIKDFLLEELEGEKLIYVRAGIEGISAYDNLLNKVVVEIGGQINVKLSNIELLENEVIVDSQAPFFVTNLNRVFYVNEITSDFELITIDLELDEFEDVELMVVNLQMTLIKTSENKYFALLSNVANPQAVEVTQTILSYILDGQISVAYKSSEVFVVIANGIVLTIA